MKLVKTTAAAGLLLATGAASAIELSGNVALTTDYVWRGVSLTDGGPAIQGGFDADLGNGAYAGVWASNVDLGGDGDVEIDVYAGYATEVAGIGVDVGFLHYAFPSTEDLSTDEIYIGLSHGPATLTAYFGADIIGDEDFGDYYDLGLDLGEYAGVAFSAHAGHYDLENNGDDYWDFKLAAGTSVMGVDVELALIDTDDADYDEEVVLTISKSL